MGEKWNNPLPINLNHVFWVGVEVMANQIGSETTHPIR